MEEHDPQSFKELFDAEPADQTSAEATKWVELYQSLVDMMERQLAETRAFGERAPDAMQQYLGRENIAILEEEIGAFKERLAHWTNEGVARPEAAQSGSAPQ